MAAVKQILEKLHITHPHEVQVIVPEKKDVEELKATYHKAGQDHVFQYYDELDLASKAALFNQLKGIDPEHINSIVKEALKSSSSEDKNNDTRSKLEPLPESATASIIDSGKDDLEAWYTHGLELIAQNKVAVVLLAGGQGTRLGSSEPKGCYNIGLLSEKSLFQLQAERIARLEVLAAQKGAGGAQVTLPWYIMTSGPTRKPTVDYFEQHKYFGLKKENVIFFEQGVLPCVSNDGKMLLESKSKVATAPDGNGGIYQALVVSGLLKDMQERGVEHIHSYCVDNCLVKVADPTFIGFASGKKVDIATKVVRKRNAKESVGLIVQKNGKPDVCEYSEMTKEDAEAKDPKNVDLLKFRAANIVSHYYSYQFLATIPQWSHQLPHHIARKKIPYLDLEKHQIVKPEKPNGIKLEQFVFDCFPLLPMDKFACMEVKREEEFSPLKNAKDTGEDDPDTSKAHILEQGQRWVAAAGGVVISEDKATGVEVSPLLSYGGEGLEFLAGKEIKAPAVIEKPDA